VKKNESNSLDTVNHDAIEAYTSALSQDSYWRLFVDGFKQRNGILTGKNAGNFEENELGHLLWASREPNNLNLLKNAALKLYSNESITEELSFEFICNFTNQYILLRTI
jgi:hypothetical protein